MFRFLKRSEGDAPDAAGRALLRILELNKEMARAARPELLPDRVLDAAIELVGAERGFLIVRPSLAPEDGGALETLGSMDEATQSWDVVAARNFDQENVRRALRKLSHSITAQVLRDGEAFRSDDAVNDESVSPAASVTELRLRSVLCVPMRVGDEVRGALYVDNRFAQGQFDASAQEILEAFADQAVLALERVRLLEESRVAREKLEGVNAELEMLVRSQNRALDSLREGWTAPEVELEYEYPRIIGRGRAMVGMLHVLDRVTGGEFPVLLSGESGTGKELVGQAIHQNGPRAQGPFIAVNCGAIAESLLESELFGVVRGAYTGAVKDRAGLVEAAEGGVLFLDEIGEMSLGLQAKLLRVLQEKTVRRVGGQAEVPVDVRVISATHRDLAREVETGGFREDLYYRLKVVQVDVPALRERREDIPVLVEHFLAEASRRASREVAPTVSTACMDRLMDHAWPGNVRELENEITRMVALGGDELGPELVEHLSSTPRPHAQGLKALVGRRMVEVEADLIRATLEATGGKRGEAAKMLGIPRRTFYNRLKALEIDQKPNAGDA